MRICSLASGSKGNSIFIESSHSRILVDAGLTAQQLKIRLESIGVEPESIDAIIITHSHRDHVTGTNVFSRQFDVPLYGHPDTLDHLSYLFKRKTKIFPWTGPFAIKDFYLTPFRLSHDANPTVGYLISSQNKKIAICTDLGVVTREVTEHLEQAEFIIIESNHDPDMLFNGPYPWELKERIASRVGHLSNHDTGNLLKTLLNGRIQKVLLAHLSDENNSLELARNTVLELAGKHITDILDIIEQRKVSPTFQF